MPEKAQLDTSRDRAKPDASVDLSVPIEMVTRNFMMDRISSENVWYTKTSRAKPSADEMIHACCALGVNFTAVGGHACRQSHRHTRVRERGSRRNEADTQCRNTS